MIIRGGLLIFSAILLGLLPPAAFADSGLAGRMLVGYQGWFGCPGDVPGNGDWQHWFVKAVQPQFVTVDLLPVLRDVSADDLCDTGLLSSDGEHVKLYSAQNPGIVQRHFSWMKQHAIDGAAVQRFVAGIQDTRKLARSDRVMANVRSAAEVNKRVFYLAYDISGADARSVVATIRRDWRHVVEDLKLTQSAAYLQENGKPVLQLWGFGFVGHPGEPSEVAHLIDDLKAGRGGLAAVTVIGGVPTTWRTLDGDSRTESGWAAVYRSYDVISPWSVGRYRDLASADAFLRDVVVPDLAEAQRLGIGYVPVVFPGFSWHNLMRNRGIARNAELNLIPRQCGKFFWRQAANLLGAGVTSLYGAMFDEVDEGTALFPTVKTRAQSLAGVDTVTLDEDGCALAEDWYLRVTGRAARYLHEGRRPPASLEDAMRD